MTIDTIPFDAAERLERDSSKLFLINDALQSGNSGYIASAIGAVARASGGLTFLERMTGIKRQTLNKSLGKDGNPTLATLVSVLNALHLQLQVVSLPSTRHENDNAAPRRKLENA